MGIRNIQKEQMLSHSLLEFSKQGLTKKKLWCSKCCDMEFHYKNEYVVWHCCICNSRSVNEKTKIAKMEEEALPWYLRGKQDGT